jgi:hypothetical protein
VRSRAPGRRKPHLSFVQTLVPGLDDGLTGFAGVEGDDVGAVDVGIEAVLGAEVDGIVVVVVGVVVAAVVIVFLGHGDGMSAARRQRPSLLFLLVSPSPFPFSSP